MKGGYKKKKIKSIDNENLFHSTNVEPNHRPKSNKFMSLAGWICRLGGR